MKILVHLPKQTAFCLKLDQKSFCLNQASFYTEEGSFSEKVFLECGVHILSAVDQVKIPVFIQKIIKFFNPMSDIDHVLDEETTFELTQETEVLLCATYGNYSRVEFLFDR